MEINDRKYIENYLKIQTKDSKIIELKLNKPQEKLYKIIKELEQQDKPIRIIILKARQMGFSTFVEALFSKRTFTSFNLSSSIVAHEEKATNNLFEMTKRFYDHLPDKLKPEKKNSNAKELVFGKLNSDVKVYTAGSSSIGRSATINQLHVSEYAFWGRDAKEKLTGLMQSVPYTKNSIVIIESTANGYNDFKKLYDDAKKGNNDFYPFFVGWDEMEEYQLPYNGETITEEEKKLQENYKLSNEQLMWRRWCIKNNCSGDTDIFKQEYPINDVEAFLSTGDCYFNKETIVKRIEELKKPLYRGEFEYDYDGLEITNISFKRKENGAITIYEVPKTEEFIIGGDTASSQGVDYSTAQVLNIETRQQVAVMQTQMDEDEYARQMYCLGKHYNNSKIAIENNYSSYPNLELRRLGYPNLYLEKVEDRTRKKTLNKLGFNTNTRTRPLILSNLKVILRDMIDYINDEETLKEALVFINNNGRPEAQQGEHDDLIMALAIAYYLIDRVEIKNRPIYQGFRAEDHFGSMKIKKEEEIRVI